MKTMDEFFLKMNLCRWMDENHLLNMDENPSSRFMAQGLSLKTQGSNGCFVANIFATYNVQFVDNLNLLHPFNQSLKFWR